MLLLLQIKGYHNQSWAEEPLTHATYKLYTDSGQRLCRGY